MNKMVNNKWKSIFLGQNFTVYIQNFMFRPKRFIFPTFVTKIMEYLSSECFFFVRQMYDLKLKIACGGTILTKKSQIKKKIHFIYITFNFLILYYCSIDIKRES